MIDEDEFDTQNMYFRDSSAFIAILAQKSIYFIGVLLFYSMKLIDPIQTTIEFLSLLQALMNNLVAKCYADFGSFTCLPIHRDPSRCNNGKWGNEAKAKCAKVRLKNVYARLYCTCLPR